MVSSSPASVSFRAAARVLISTGIASPLWKWIAGEWRASKSQRLKTPAAEARGRLRRKGAKTQVIRYFPTASSLHLARTVADPHDGFPDDPHRPGRSRGANAGPGRACEDLAQLRHTLGLDQPLGVQYVRYLEGLARGDWGRSLRFAAPVRPIVLERFPATLELSLAALAVCIAIAIPAGILSARRRGSGADRATSFFTLLGLSVPNFALGPILILVFSVEIGWLPVSGRGGISHLILPAATPRGGARGHPDAHGPRIDDRGAFQRLRAHARAKGHHGNGRAVPPRFSERADSGHNHRGIAIRLAARGPIVTETIFSWPGIGRLAVQAISRAIIPYCKGAS